MKEIQFELAFFKEGTFQSYYAACGWLEKNGYSYGSMCGHEPVALLKGDYSIAKWKNLSKEERQDVDGIMTGDFREGEVKITIYKKTTCDLDDDGFEPCDHCDLPDACADFGCAIKNGVRKDAPIDGVF